MQQQKYEKFMIHDNINRKFCIQKQIANENHNHINNNSQSNRSRIHRDNLLDKIIIDFINQTLLEILQPNNKIN